MIKKRKAEENLEAGSVDQFSASHVMYSEGDPIPQQSVIVSSDSEDNFDVQSDCDVFSDTMPPGLLPEEPEICDELDLTPHIIEDETVGDGSQSSEATTLAIFPFNLLVEQYSVCHNLTHAALADLQLFRLHSAAREILPPSLYVFEKQFQSLKCPMTFHYFCSSCLQLLPNGQVTGCPNEACHRQLGHSVGTVSSFIEISLEFQLINLM